MRSLLLAVNGNHLRLISWQRILVTLIHVAVSDMLLVLMGALRSLHMRGDWRRRTQRCLVLLLLGLSLAGLSLYYLGDLTLAAINSALHVLFGVDLFFFFIWHWLHGLTMNQCRTSRKNN